MEKMICMTSICATWSIDDNFVAGRTGLVRDHLPWSQRL